MSGRRYGSDVSIDRYAERRDYASRTGGGGRRYEDRFVEEEIDYRRGSPARERDVLVREEIRERETSRTGPAYLREDYGRTTAGPVVLRARETEDFEFIPRPRRRSPSPEPERKVEKNEIIIRREEPEARPPPRVRERDTYDREEIIIRRDEREREPPRLPPPPRESAREEIIIRRDEREREPERLPPPPREREREEIIIRRDEREPERLPPPPRERDREEIIIRRDERDRDIRAPLREERRERDDIIIRRDEGPRGSRIEIDERDDVVSRRGGFRPARDDYNREEIIIRRDEKESDDRISRYTSRQYDDYALTRPKSHERERSRVRRTGSESEHDREIIIRREEREGRHGDREREEIIIRNTSRSRSPSPSAVSTRTAAPAPEPPVIHAPAIHQEVITHHRHIDHGFELAIATRPRPVSRPPSPPTPPPPRERSEERIQIYRSGERNGRAYDEDIIIDHKEGGRRTPAPIAPPARDPYYDAPPARREPLPPPEPLPREPIPPPGLLPYRDRGYERDVREEAEYYNSVALQRSYVGEAYNGATRDWAIVDVPPGTNRVRMNGAGGGEQEITWQRYNGVRRSKFYPDGMSDEGYGSEVGRPAPMPAAGGEIGRRYGRERDPREGLWTEITKDLVVKEAIQQAGYEFEETDDFYYIIAYLKYEDIARLVGLSEDIRKDRRKRVKEMEWESRVMPPAEEPAPRLMIEPPPPRREREREREWDREDERYIEREVIYRGGRPPPPPGWRR